MAIARDLVELEARLRDHGGVDLFAHDERGGVLAVPEYASIVGRVQNLHLAGLRIDLDVALGGEAGRHRARVHRRRGDDRRAGLRPLGGNLVERQWLEVADVAARRPGAAVLPDHALRVDVPHLGRPYAQLLDYLLGGLDHGHAGGESDARAAGEMRIADRRGVGDDRAYPVIVDPQRLGRHNRHRGARAADVEAAGRDDDRAVLVDMHGGAQFAAAVEINSRR